MQTLVALDKCLDEDQRQMTEAVRPSSQELVVARRQLHRKAAVIAVLAITSYTLHSHASPSRRTVAG